MRRLSAKYTRASISSLCGKRNTSRRVTKTGQFIFGNSLSSRKSTLRIAYLQIRKKGKIARYLSLSTYWPDKAKRHGSVQDPPEMPASAPRRRALMARQPKAAGLTLLLSQAADFILPPSKAAGLLCRR